MATKQGQKQDPEPKADAKPKAAKIGPIKVQLITRPGPTVREAGAVLLEGICPSKAAFELLDQHVQSGSVSVVGKTQDEEDNDQE